MIPPGVPQACLEGELRGLGTVGGCSVATQGSSEAMTERIGVNGDRTCHIRPPCFSDVLLADSRV